MRIGARPLVAVILVPVLLYLGAMIWVSLHPPFASTGYSWSLAPASYTVGVEVKNLGRWPLRLVEAHLADRPTIAVTAWTSESGWLAFNQATIRDGQDAPHRAGPVAGLRVEPDCACLRSYAVRFELPRDPPAAEERVVIRYRYLGWPFKAVVPVKIETAE